MKYIRAKAGFIRYPDDALVVAASRIIKSLERSAYFPDPIPSLQEIVDAYTDYYAKLVQAKGGGSYYRAQKRESKTRLAVLLQQLVPYINRVSDGNLVKLHSSGYPIVGERKKRHLPYVPENPYLADGRLSGEVAYGFKPVGRDMLYEFCFADKVDDKGIPLWGDIMTSSRSFRAYRGGYTPTSNIYFRVRTKNKHGVSAWSVTVSWMVR